MSLLAVTSSSGFEYLNLALAERIMPLGNGCVDVQFSRTVVTLSGIDAQRVLRWAQQQSEQTLAALPVGDGRATVAPSPDKHSDPQAMPSVATRALDLPTFRSERLVEPTARTEPSWRLR